MNQSDFKSYAYQDLTSKEIKKYAKQYEGVDMAKLMGASEDRFPFLIQEKGREFSAMWWDKNIGMMKILDEDSVRSYATAIYLRENAYPVFTDFKEAQTWAKEHSWPLNKSAEPGASDNADKPRRLS